MIRNLDNSLEESIILKWREDAMSDPTAPVTYTAAFATFASGLTINHWVAGIGVIIGVAQFFRRWYYEHQHFKLAKYERNRRKDDVAKDERLSK